MSVEKTEIETFFGRCRCCLSYGYLKNMWSEHDFEGQTEIYGEMLVQCFALSWEHSEDTMEQDQICEQCISRLRDANDFKKLVLDSQEELLHKFNAENEIIIKEEVLQDQYLEDDTADTTYADTEYTIDTADTGGSVKDEMEYQEIEYLEDEDLEDTKDNIDIDSVQPSGTRRRQLVNQDDEGTPKRKWPKKLPKAERLKTYKQYSEEDFRKCMEAVRNSEMTPQQASRMYNVPKKTICAKLKMDPKDVQIDNTTESELSKPNKSNLRSNSPVYSIEVAEDRAIEQIYELIDEWEGADEKELETTEDAENPEYSDMNKHKNNVKAVLQNSNATIIKYTARNGYLCNFCERHFATPSDLKLHNFKVHARQAGETMKTKYISELVVKLDITDLMCKLCKTSIDSLENLLQHLSNLHSVLIHTDIKNYMIPFKFDTDAFKCVICKKTFNYFYVLMEHMFEHYRNFMCPLCDRSFITKQAMQSHSHKHQSSVFKCPHCPTVFETPMKRHEHMKSEHTNPSTYRKCEHCDETFQTWNLLVNHVVKIHGVKPPVLSCDECGKTCITQSSLKHHKNHFHLDPNPLKCPRCVKTFLSTTDLQAHLNTHSKSKEYTCRICDKVYSSPFYLNKHVRTHLNIVKYFCDYCDRQFVHKTYFRAHMLKKHGEIV